MTEQTLPDYIRAYIDRIARGIHADRPASLDEALTVLQRELPLPGAWERFGFEAEAYGRQVLETLLAEPKSAFEQAVDSVISAMDEEQAVKHEARPEMPREDLIIEFDDDPAPSDTESDIGEPLPEPDLPEIVPLTSFGELRRGLVSGIVCLTDTDNAGEVRHQFVTQNRGMIHHLAGGPFRLSESTRTMLSGYDVIAGVEVQIQPDYYTGVAHLAANLKAPESDGLRLTEGYLILDTLAGAYFVTSEPTKAPIYGCVLPAVAGIDEDNRLMGVYPTRPVARSLTHDDTLTPDL